MTAGKDNIFARWSRRKQAVRDFETPAPDVQEASHAAASEPDAEPVDQQPGRELDAAEPLPSLEDLTAESDLSAFLRDGVPRELKSAALRKMWSLDPAIRDHIGLSEYAWDFNQPGSMAGFGPLDASETIVADFLSTMSGGVRAGLKDVTAASEDLLTRPSQQVSAVEPNPDADIPPEEAADAISPAAPPEAPPAPADHLSRSTDQIAVAAEPSVTAKPAETPPSPARPRHGGALPRHD